MLRNLNVNIVNNTPARVGGNKSSSILKTPAAANNNQQQRSFFGVFSSASLSQEDLKSPFDAIKKEVLLATGEKQQKGLGRRSSSVPLSFEVPRHASVKKEVLFFVVFTNII
jgi:hypothetical protein